MKQIFDWLREQMQKVETEVYSPADVVWNNAVKNCMIKTYEAEAKWESDCCEYEYHVAPSKDIYYLTSCKNRHNGMLIANRPYCGYCGKPIKISEVV